MVGENSSCAALRILVELNNVSVVNQYHALIKDSVFDAGMQSGFNCFKCEQKRFGSDVLKCYDNNKML